MTARRLVHLPITALLLLTPTAARALPPGCSEVGDSTFITCSAPRGGPAQIFYTDIPVTYLGGCANETLTLSSTPALSFTPSSFPIGSGTTRIHADGVSPSGLPPHVNLVVRLQGCNTSCSQSFPLSFPAGFDNPCLGLTGSTPVCTGTGAQGCTYGTTLDLRVDPVTAGAVTLSSSVGSVAPQTAPAVHGHQALPVTLTVPCGTPTVTLDLVYSLGGLGSPERLEQTVDLALPLCNDILSGTKYADPNHNDQRDPGEPGLAGWRIFADLNGNGKLDAGEPSAVTDANGQYSFSVPHGAPYSVAEVPQPGWMATAPASGSYAVSQSASGLDFGNWPCKLTTSNFLPLLCTGDSTTVPLLPFVPPGPVTWYATTDCATTAVPPAPPWTALGPGGPVWSTLALDQTTCYRAGIGGLSGCADPLLSSAVSVFVHPIAPAPVVTCGLPGGGSCGAAACGPIQPTLQVTGACTPQWQQLVAGTWQDVPGATAATFTPPPLAAAQCPANGFDFRAVSSCRGCQASPLSNVADLAVFAPSQAGTLSALKGSICPGDDDVVTLAGQCGETVQWQSDAGGSFQDIAGALGPTVWLTNRLFQTTSYRTVVSNGPCAKAVSAPVKITLLQKPAVALGAGGPTRFCAPGSVLLSATFSPPGGSFVWFKDGVALTPPSPFSTRLVTQTGNYAVRYLTPCGEARSSVVQVLASQPAAAILGPCGLCQPGCVTLQAVAAGGAAPYSFRWLPGNASGPQISACAPASYSVAVVDALGCRASAVQAVGLCQRLQIVAGAARNIAHGASTVLGGTPTATGGVGPYTYSWFPSAGLSNPQAPNPLARPFSSTTYTVTVTDAKGCTGRASVFVHVSRLFPLSKPVPAPADPQVPTLGAAGLAILLGLLALAGLLMLRYRRP